MQQNKAYDQGLHYWYPLSNISGDILDISRGCKIGCFEDKYGKEFMCPNTKIK